MDVVGGIASSTQLVNYTGSAAGQLISLYRLLQNGPSIVNEHLCNIKYQLEIVNSLSSYGTPDARLLLLLSEIRRIAEDLTKYLSQRSQLKTFWTLVAKGVWINDEQNTLKKKSRLLQLYLIAQNHHSTARIQSGLDQITRNMAPVHTLQDLPQVSHSSIASSASSNTYTGPTGERSVTRDSESGRAKTRAEQT